mmetsp:Transcript_56225/g.146584  ORF Transcript_56225/g.146584 Transcript_56225/m.146584 type:complete len:94 (-) Transcript_56225:14-295(-)
MLFVWTPPELIWAQCHSLGSLSPGSVAAGAPHREVSSCSKCPQNPCDGELLERSIQCLLREELAEPHNEVWPETRAFFQNMPCYAVGWLSVFV